MSRFSYEKISRGRFVISDEDDTCCAGPETYGLTNRIDVERLVDLLNQLEGMKGKYSEGVAELDFEEETHL